MSIVVVLHQSQDLVNIAAVVRAMKNFGFRDLRLVEPEEYDVHRIEGIAHNSYDVLERVRMFPTLDEALADCIVVVGLTARQRTAKRNVVRPRDVAPSLVERAAAGTVAVVLGPEDRGLSNADLDRCHQSVVIPTSPEFPSLNLAQAFTVMAYELYVAAGVNAFKPPRRRAEAARQEQLEQLFRDVERTLDVIEFFKTRNPEPIMRTLREVARRRALDRREVKLLRAMCLEVVHFLERSKA
ncbi:MAG TPA: TrmJ/YjtD family RNA methyltransferase [Gemmatimonadales bacterium]|jgi:TrmH family RNA methyltransferase